MHFMLDSSEKGGSFVFICTSDQVCQGMIFYLFILISKRYITKKYIYILELIHTSASIFNMKLLPSSHPYVCYLTARTSLNGEGSDPQIVLTPTTNFTTLLFLFVHCYYNSLFLMQSIVFLLDYLLQRSDSYHHTTYVKP